MYINADELFKLVGITPTKEAVNLINDRFYIRNKFVQHTDIERLKDTIEEIAVINGIAYTEIINNYRHRKFVSVRQEATYLLNLLGYRDCEIKKIFGKNHATISYYRDVIKDNLDVYPKFRADFYRKYSHILERFQIANNLTMN